jgi:predicted ATPase
MVFRPAGGWVNLAALTVAAIPIRTPDQRLRVFVSSTLQELSAERSAVAEAVRAIRLTPVMFELGARPHPPRDLYRAYLTQSDVFVGIYWQRYGWVAPGEAISGLEDEYLLSGPMPKLIYIKRGDEREPRLAELIKRIQADDRVSYRPFAEADELRELVKDDLAVMLTERFATAASAAVGRVDAASASPAAPPGEPTQADLPPRYELPLERGDLIGRASLVSSVADLLGRPEVGIVTLTGPGGTGKTRLAIHVGHAQRAAFEGNVYYVELAGVRAAEDVLPAIQTTLEIPLPASGGDPEKLLVAHLRRQRALLVLDNFEQVLDAAPAVARLAAACPRLKILVTSRESLRVRGEYEQPVPPLSLDVVAGGALSPCVTLFEQRAREVRPDFRVDAENRAAVVEICRHLDGLPLAVELAAARTRVLSPQAMLPRLDRSLSLLTSQRRDLPARQQTLRAALCWSYDLLRPDEQAFFRRLGTFTGGFFEEAAAEVTAGTGVDVLDGLTSLADKSLLSRSEQDGLTRFHLLETVREFALERLGEAGEEQEARTRHARWVRDLFGGACGLITRQAGRQVWFKRLALEEGNARAALRFASTPGGDRTLLWDLYCKLAFSLVAAARAREARALYDELLVGGEADDPVLAVVAHEEAHRGDVLNPDAHFAPRLERCVSVLEQAGDRVYLPSALVSCGMILMVAAPERALSALTRGVDLAVEARQESVESWGRTIVCWFHMVSGDLDACAAAADALVARSAANSDAEGEAFGRTVQGRLSCARGDMAAARGHFAEAVALSSETATSWSRADALECLCSVTMELGDTRASLQILREALLFIVPLGSLGGTPLLFGALAKLLADAGERERALRVLSAVPASLESMNPVFLKRADPTGSLIGATRQALAALAVSPKNVSEESLDLDAALRAALE